MTRYQNNELTNCLLMIIVCFGMSVIMAMNVFAGSDNAFEAAKRKAAQMNAARKAGTLRTPPPKRQEPKVIVLGKNPVVVPTRNFKMEELLTKGEMLFLINKIRNCPRAIELMESIIDSERPLMQSDRDALLTVVAMQDAKDAFKALKK